jgi:hypothetical protein
LEQRSPSTEPKLLQVEDKFLLLMVCFDVLSLILLFFGAKRRIGKEL